MRPARALALLALLVLASCATNPLCIPPPPHALPKWRRPAEAAAAAESRPQAIAEGFDAPAGDDGAWRAGDSIALALEFEDGGVRERYWLRLEIEDEPVVRDDGSVRVYVRTTLLDQDGAEIDSAVRRVNPDRIGEAGGELFAAYSSLVAAAASGTPPEQIQERIDEEMAEGSLVFDAMRTCFRELRRTAAPRFVRQRLKDPAINASIGSISIVDMAMAAIMPVEVLIDVVRLNEEQAALADFDDLPVQAVRIPFVFSIGGTIHLRFAVTLAQPVAPYAMTAGLVEIAGVNEARGDRRFLVRVVGAKRGPASAAESRDADAASSRPHDRSPEIPAAASREDTDDPRR
jgi:hypothetical protein